MTRDEYERTILEKRKIYFDQQICENAELSDIAEEKVRWFLRKAKVERRLNISPEISIKEALDSYSVNPLLDFFSYLREQSLLEPFYFQD